MRRWIEFRAKISRLNPELAHEKLFSTLPIEIIRECLTPNTTFRKFFQGGSEISKGLSQNIYGQFKLRSIHVYLSDEIKEVESWDKDDWHPTAQAAARHFRLNAGKEGQSDAVGQTNRQHVRPNVLGYFQARQEAICDASMNTFRRSRAPINTIQNVYPPLTVCVYSSVSLCLCATFSLSSRLSPSLCLSACLPRLPKIFCQNENICLHSLIQYLKSDN